MARGCRRSLCPTPKAYPCYMVVTTYHLVSSHRLVPKNGFPYGWNAGGDKSTTDYVFDIGMSRFTECASATRKVMMSAIVDSFSSDNGSEKNKELFRPISKLMKWKFVRRLYSLCFRNSVTLLVFSITIKQFITCSVILLVQNLMVSPIILFIPLDIVVVKLLNVICTFPFKSVFVIEMLNLLTIIQTPRVRRLCFIAANVVIVILVIILCTYQNKSDDTSEDEKIILSEKNEFSCHYLKDEGALKALDKLVKFQPNAIFFIESSCEGLTSRQACSIESAAKANPDRQIIVLFTSPMSWEKYKTNGLSVVLAMENTEAARIHIEDYSKGTPFYTTLKKKPLTPDDINTNIGDILKYVTIYKYSGIYLGLDVLVARPFDDLKANWIVKESPATISADMFAFSSNKNGRSLAEIASNIVLSDLSIADKQDLWTFDNCKPMNQLANIWCTSSEILYLRTSMCKDLQVKEPDGFLPIPVHERLKYFDQGEWRPLKNETIYTYQTFDYLTKYNIVPKNSLYDKLAKKYCPAVYAFFGVNFGLF